jgi:hypothetical protein
VKRLGFPTDDLPLELDDGTRTMAAEKRRRRAPRCRTCACVQLPHAGEGPHCPKCGSSPSARCTSTRRTASSSRSKRKPKISTADKERVYAELLGYAKERGFKDGWAYHKCVELYGSAPRNRLEADRAEQKTRAPDPSPEHQKSEGKGKGASEFDAEHPTTKRPDVLIEARGRWPGLLAAIGVEEKSLSGSMGRARYRAAAARTASASTTRRGAARTSARTAARATASSSCMLVKGVGFKDSLTSSRELLPLAPEMKRAKERTRESKGRRCARCGTRRAPIASRRPVDRYLARAHPHAARRAARGGAAVLRRRQAHRRRTPAMVARITTPDGKGASLHVTYSHARRRARPASRRRRRSCSRCGPSWARGAAVRCGDTLGVAEGIETASRRASCSACRCGRR